MAITRVQFKQTAGAAAGSTSPAVTLDSTPTQGNLLYVRFLWNQAGGSDSTLTPPGGWTEHPQGDLNLTGDCRQRSFWKLAGAGESATISGTLSVSKCWIVDAFEYSATAGWAGNPVDRSASDTNASSSSPTTGSPSGTRIAEEVWVAVLGNKNTTLQTSPSNGYASVATVATANGTATQNVSAGLYEKIVAATANPSMTATLAVARACVGSVITFAASQPVPRTTYPQNQASLRAATF